ncbi:MAG TPA: hypothetical protein VND21_06285, partial [Planctomycetota bacterium]|nr:hypothetical protein [Planctomycetota bacterium]
MMVVAAFFTSFLLFLALGLLALAVTAALDRPIGKERALLLWALVILGITFALRPSAPAPASPKPSSLVLKEGFDPTRPLGAGGDVLVRAALAPPTRNPFQEQSDTSALPPE